MAELKLSLVPYDECKRELLAFRNANRQSQRCESDFDWRYLKRPNGTKPVIVWAEMANEKIGALSLIPHNFFINNEDFHLGVLGDISVSKNSRGKGIAKRMFTFLAGLDEFKCLKVSIVLPNKDASIPLERAGWTTVSRMHRYVKILSAGGVLKKKRLRGVLPSIVAPLFDLFLRCSPYELLFRLRQGYAWELTEGFDFRFDELWNTLSKDNMVIGKRDKEYLAWRYSSHTFVQYKIFTIVNNSKLCGYIVFHVNEDTCYIDDFLCLQENNVISFLLFYFIKFVREKNLAASIDLRANINSLLKLPLWKFGFLKRPDNQFFMIHATLPPEELGFFANGSNWFLTAGDKDV